MGPFLESPAWFYGYTGFGVHHTDVDAEKV